MNSAALAPKKKSALRQAVPFMGLIAIILFFYIVTEGRLFGPRTFSTLFNEFFSLVVAGCGVMFVMCEGNIDFSIGSNMGVTMAVAAIASQEVGWWVIFPITIVGGMLLGVMCGVLVSNLRVPAFIATIGMSFMLRGLVTIILDSGPKGCDYGFMVCNDITLKLIVLVIFVALMFVLFNYTKFGRQCKAIGANQTTASQSGVDVRRMILLPYILSGFCTGIGAAFNLAKSVSAAPATGDGFQFNVMLALMLGGFPIDGGWSARFRSILIGSCMYAIIMLGLTTWGASTDIQQLVKGVVFIISVALSFDRKASRTIK